MFSFLGSSRYVRQVTAELRSERQLDPAQFRPKLKRAYWYSLRRLHACQSHSVDSAADMTVVALETVASKLKPAWVTDKRTAIYVAQLFRDAMLEQEKTAENRTHSLQQRSVENPETPDTPLETAIAMMRVSLSLWERGLSGQERERPEAAAVLQGMFNSIVQTYGLASDHALVLGAFDAALGDVDRQISPNLTTGTLVKRMLRATSDPRLLSWVCYAGDQILSIRRLHLDPTDVVLKILEAAKAGHFSNPAAMAKAQPQP